MNVKQLIEKLQEQDDNQTVLVEFDNDWMHEITEVSVIRLDNEKSVIVMI